jgi:hypothetical protein|tara:strand:+ start:2011 stop:3249 length:1239 start_codon:yes stop_codon:yes gene_type:complete
MPYRVYKNKSNTRIGGPLINKIKGEVSSLIRENQYDFYELEPFEVQEVLLDKKLFEGEGALKSKYYGAVRGRFINESNQAVLDNGGNGFVLPMDTHIKNYPVIGEIVVCTNFLGRTYYTNILNWRNNPNNCIQAGISSNQKVNLPALPQIPTDLQYGSPVVSEPGDIVIEGRLNNYIILGKQDEIGSSIKLVAGDDSNDINKSKASIFIQDDGTVKVDNPNKAFPSTTVTGAKIVLNADDIVINARNTLKIQSGEVTEIIGEFVELKHNAGGQVITGETEQFVEELRGKAIKEVTDVIEAEVQVLKDTANITMEAYNKQVQNIKKLTESVKNARKNVEKTIKTVRNTSFTMNGQKFTKLQDQVNKLQTELASTPPTDPVRIARLGLELTNVFRSFVTLDFLNKDIVTIEQKK